MSDFKVLDEFNCYSVKRNNESEIILKNEKGDQITISEEKGSINDAMKGFEDLLTCKDWEIGMDFNDLDEILFSGKAGKAVFKAFKYDGQIEPKLEGFIEEYKEKAASIFIWAAGDMSVLDMSEIVDPAEIIDILYLQIAYYQNVEPVINTLIVLN